MMRCERQSTRTARTVLPSLWPAVEVARRGLPLALIVLALMAGMGATVQAVRAATAHASMSQDCATFGVAGCGPQGAAGAVVYGHICVVCHGERLEGGEGPPLAGPGSALGEYRTGVRLFEYISTWMPDDAPGSLSEREYLDVTAFLLHANQVHPGGEITLASLERVMLR